MFSYEKKLQYPVKIKNPNPNLAKIILTQYGGPDGELGASLRYLSQRYSMPFDELKGLLTDIGTEELGHLEMIGAIVHQLTRNLKGNQMKDPAFAPSAGQIEPEECILYESSDRYLIKHKMQLIVDKFEHSLFDIFSNESSSNLRKKAFILIKTTRNE